MTMTLFKSLYHRPFALMLSGESISNLGDSLYRIALAWWVLEKTGSATAMGTVLIFSFTPMLLFLLIGGVAVDRLPRVLVMFVSEILCGVAVGVVALLAANNLLEIWHVYIASIIFGLVNGFYQPAYEAMIPDIVPSEALNSANALNSLSKQLTRVLGPAVGASITSVGGTSIAFALDSLSFFISAACLIPLMKQSQRSLTKTQPTSIIVDLFEGINTVLRLPWLWITIVIVALLNVTVGAPINVTLPFLVKNNLQANVISLGLMYSAISLGGVLGVVWVGHTKTIRRRGLIIYCAIIVSGLTSVVLGLSINLIGFIIALLLSGASGLINNLIWTNVLQEYIPRDVFGRVTSIDQLGSLALLPIGFGIAGWATDLIGAPMVFIVGGLVTIALGTIALTHPTIRHLD